MINLLPDSQKREIFIGTVHKKIVWLLFFISLAFIIFIGAMYGVKTFVDSAIDDVNIKIEQKNTEFEASQFQEFKKTILAVNQEIAKVRAFWYEQLSTIKIIGTIASITPSSIYFTSLSFQKESYNTARVDISGTASTRSDLFYFKQSLEMEENLRDVYFSPSSWVKPADVGFVLNLKFSTAPVATSTPFTGPS